MPRDLGLDDVVSQYPEAAQELAELNEANAVLQRELAVLRMDISNRQHFEDTLRADLAAARKDAERYRWLRPQVGGQTWRNLGIVYSEPSGIDELIDAKIAALNEQKP